MLSTPPLFEAIKERWQERNLGEVITGGVYMTRESVPERAVRPYAKVDPISEVPAGFTNKGQYDNVNFQVAIYEDDFERAAELAGMVDDAIKHAPLNLKEGFELVYLRPAPVRYLEEDYHWIAILEYQALVSKDPNYNPE